MATSNRATSPPPPTGIAYIVQVLVEQGILIESNGTRFLTPSTIGICTATAKATTITRLSFASLQQQLGSVSVSSPRSPRLFCGALHLISVAQN